MLCMKVNLLEIAWASQFYFPPSRCNRSRATLLLQFGGVTELKHCFNLGLFYRIFFK